MQFGIREAKISDYRGLCEMYREVDSLHAQAVPDVIRMAEGRARSRQYIAHLIRDKDALLLLAESEGSPAGFVCAFLKTVPDIPVVVPRRYISVDCLGVRPDFRRHGVGEALMRAVHDWALRRDVDKVELNVWEFNTNALAFYEQLGYETSSRRMWITLGEKT